MVSIMDLSLFVLMLSPLALDKRVDKLGQAPYGESILLIINGFIRSA